MHVIKVPVVHKFGIISHCQRLQLQTRLFEEISRDKSDLTNRSINANPFEISDEFVDNYNAVIASTLTSKETKREIIDRAQKLFLKIKRRVGLKYNCESEGHINLALGWTELAILTQCDGDIGQDSLDLLLLSLNAAPISNRAFSVLFYLLETVLYFIQVHKFQSTSPEKHIKWLLVGEIVAIRIYLQCVLRLSQGWKEKLDNLAMYIKDFKECHLKFAEYPELAISFCVIEEVTNYLLTSNEASNIIGEDNDNKKEETTTYHCGSFMWHTVDLCRCFSYTCFKSQIPDCIDGIRNCLAQGCSLGDWIECYLAIRVMANAASLNETGLDIFASVIRGLIDTNHTIIERKKHGKDRQENTVGELEKGELLLMMAMREFVTLPLLAKNSVVRERSLSTIAEILLSKESTMSVILPSKIREIMVSRIEAVLNICERNEDVSSIYVIKNSIWCLLAAVKRRRILAPGADNCYEKYGRIVASTMYSREFHELPQTANNRIACILIQYLLPVFPILTNGSKTPLIELGRVRQHPVPPKNDKHRLKIAELTKKKMPVIKRDSCYAQQADNKLRNILENYWNLELPNLQKTLDESVVTDESK